MQHLEPSQDEEHAPDEQGEVGIQKNQQPTKCQLEKSRLLGILQHFPYRPVRHVAADDQCQHQDEVHREFVLHLQNQPVQASEVHLKEVPKGEQGQVGLCFWEDWLPRAGRGCGKRCKSSASFWNFDNSSLPV